jgi:hypothetical protein
MATKRRKKRSASKRTAIRKTGTRRKRITRRKKGMLSEFFSAATARETAMNTAGAAGGGAIAFLIDRMTPNQTPINKALYIGAAAFATGAVLKRPMLSAGMAGVAAYIALSTTSLLADHGDEWADDIEALPPFISEGGNFELADPYLLSQDANDINGILETSSMPAYAPQFNQF